MLLRMRPLTPRSEMSAAKWETRSGAHYSVLLPAQQSKIVRLLFGGRMLRRRKLRRLAIAHLLRERAA